MAPRDPNKLLRYLRWIDRRERMQRRQFLQMMAAAGIGAIGASSLAACGSEDNGDSAEGSNEGSNGSGSSEDSTDSATSDDASNDGADYTEVEGYEKDDRWAGTTLVVADWGGSLRDAYRQVVYDPFSELTGCEIVEDTSDSAILRSQVESGNVEWSVVNGSGNTSLIHAREGLLEPLDYDVIDDSGLLEGVADEYTLSAYYWSSVMAYSTEEFGDSPPESWADFWDVDNVPGARGLYDWPIPNLEFALLADGASIDDIYPIDFDHAFEVMDQIKNDILVWWDAGAQPPQLISDGELALTSAWSGRIANAEGGAAIQWNQGSLQVDRYVVPKGAPELEVAMDLINFMTRPEVQGRLANLIPYGPTDERAFDYVDDDVAESLPSSPNLREQQYEMDYDFWLEHEDEIVERWEGWILG